MRLVIDMQERARVMHALSELLDCLCIKIHCHPSVPLRLNYLLESQTNLMTAIPFPERPQFKETLLKKACMRLNNARTFD